MSYINPCCWDIYSIIYSTILTIQILIEGNFAPIIIITVDQLCHLSFSDISSVLIGFYRHAALQHL